MARCQADARTGAIAHNDTWIRVGYAVFIHAESAIRTIGRRSLIYCLPRISTVIRTLLKALAVSLCVLSIPALGAERMDQPTNTIQHITVKRCPGNPLITFDSSSSLGININGPSVIKAPPWVKSPLSKYYMYFANHTGQHIRMAYADNLAGPWTTYEPGVMHLKHATAITGHIASPDVHVDTEKELVRMYFHGQVKGQIDQKTLMATSKDGLSFQSGNEILGIPYFRVFRWGEYFYAIDGSGALNRSRLPGSGWHMRKGKLVPPITVEDAYGRRENMRIRHPAVMLKGDILYLFYTRKGDAPERIYLSTVALSGDWNQWTASEPIEVIRPREIYEGVQYPVRPSEAGSAIKVHQIRDPYVFVENGKLYLFYSVAGEMGIAMAEFAIEHTVEQNTAADAGKPPR
jgi:hypothetical protein